MTDDNTAEPGSTDAPPTEPAASEATPDKRRTWIWIVVAVAVLALAGLAYAATQQSGGNSWLLLFGGGGVEVPQLVGLPQSDAEAALETAGLRVGKVSDSPTLAVAPGLVVTQSPAASTKVEADSAVDMAVSAIPQVKVPDVVGQTESQASATLAEQGLPLGTTTYVYDTSVEPGYVKSQTPAAGTETKVGTTVALTVSKGQQTGQVPDVVGLSQNDAQSTLEGASFKVTVTNATSLDVPAGDVMSQSPAGGTTATTGSNVAITVSKGAPASTPATPSTPAAPSTPVEPGEPPAAKATVPNVIGMGVLKAIATLRDADLKFSIDFAKATENYLKVATQDPAAGTEVEPGYSVTIYIGLPAFLFGEGGDLPSKPATAAPTPTPLPSTPTTPADSSVTTP